MSDEFIDANIEFLRARELFNCADMIESLQAENARLTSELRTAKASESHKEAMDVIGDLQAENARLTSEVARLRKSQLFAGKIMHCYNEAWASDIDGGDIQEWGVETGMLERIERKAINDGDWCANCDGDCDYCYRFTAECQEAVDAAIAKP